MRDPKIRIASQTKVWLRKCQDLGILNDVIADIRNADIRKEKGNGKETFPPAPPIEKRESQEKATTTTTARARARGRLSEEFPPTAEMVYAECEAEKIPRLYGDYFMDRQAKENWRHPQTLCKLLSWRKALRIWWNCEGSFPGRSSWEDYQQEHQRQERSERRYNIFGGGAAK